MKQVLSLIMVVLVLAGGYLCVRIAGKVAAPVPPETGQKKIPPTSPGPRDGKERKNVKAGQYKAIVERNLFRVEIHPPAASTVPKTDTVVTALKKTDLKLALWGTVVGTGDIYAVIEDKQQRRQGLYQVGDTLQGATIKKITRHQVVLTHHGEERVLEMVSDTETASASAVPPASSPEKSAPRPESKQAPVETLVLLDTSPDMGQLKGQIRFRPRVAGGSPDGMLLYGIRADSVFGKLGLRNGDILKELNGLPVATLKDMEVLFNEMAPDREGRLVVLRRGRLQDINFKIRRSQ